MKPKVKHLTILLAFSLILNSIPGTNASAAKKVSITKKSTVTVGKKVKIKLKNNKKKVTWKITKGKSIVKIEKKTKTYATIQGVKKGSAKVQAKIGKKKYTCTVTVKAKDNAKPTPAPTTQPTKVPTTTTAQPTGTGTATPSTEPTGTPTATPTQAPTTTASISPTETPEPTGTPGQDEVLTLYYNADNAVEIIGILRNSDIPVHVIVEDSVTRIGDVAFIDCSSLTSITIPDSVTSIGDQVFYGCSGLTSITVAEGNNTYDSRENCNAIIETETNSLIAGCKNTVIPENVTRIGYFAFYGSGLTSISIPDSVTSIGYAAFSGCSGLTSITVAEGNSTYDSRENCNAIIETETNSLIAGCKNTVISENVTHIEDMAFGGCSGLTSISIPDSVTSIGYYAFSYCSGLTSITVAEGNDRYDSRENCNAIIETDTNTLVAGCKNTVIPDSVTSIRDYAFSGRSGLTSISIPDGVTSIGDYAFYNCSGLTSISIPDSVTSIGYAAFSFCSALTSISIPGSVTSIGDQVFYGCSGLTSISIPDSVTSIGYVAFSGCSALTSISIPDSVTSILGGAFSNCSALTSITWKGSTYTSVDEFLTAFEKDTE